MDLELENLTRFLAAMKETGLRPRLPVRAESLLSERERNDWILNKNLHAFTFWSPDTVEQLDLLLVESGHSTVLDRAIIIEAGELRIPVVAIDDLIAMKLRASRLQDQSDIQALEQVKRISEQ